MLKNFFTKTIMSVMMLSISVSGFSTSTYRVKTGDTLGSIALQYNVSQQKLMDINNIKSPDSIRTGDLLLINDSTAHIYTGATTSYTVQSGDNLSTIVKKYDTTPTVLAELNPSLNANFDQIRVGQILVVPAVTTTTTSVPVKKFTGRNIAYTVKKGDTFLGIANRYNIKAIELAKVNNVDVLYKVKEGETLYVPEVEASLRDLVEKKTTEGEASVKTNKTTTPKATTTKTTTTKTTNTTSKTAKPTTLPLKLDSVKYVVKPGDTLGGVANRNNVTLGTLAEFNHLKTDSLLKIGQVLYIPVPVVK